MQVQTIFLIVYLLTQLVTPKSLDGGFSPFARETLHPTPHSINYLNYSSGKERIGLPCQASKARVLPLDDFPIIRCD